MPQVQPVTMQQPAGPAPSASPVERPWPPVPRATDPSAPPPPPSQQWPPSPAPAKTGPVFPQTAATPVAPAPVGAPTPLTPPGPAAAAAPTAPLPPTPGSTPAGGASRAAAAPAADEAPEPRRRFLGIPLPAPRPATEPGDADGRSTLQMLLHSLPVRIAAGVAVASLIAGGLFATVLRPAPVVLPPHVINIPLPAPTFAPVAVENPTEFLAVLPTATLTYGLTAYESYDAEAITSWPARFAESWFLTYGDGSGSEMTVIAVQHFSEEDALSAWNALVAGYVATSDPGDPTPAPQPSPLGTLVDGPSPVMTGNVQAGESITVQVEITETVEGAAGEEPTERTRTVTQVIWRNGNGVFVMTSDAANIADLFLEYGV